jgi:hypothetical protein
LVESETNIDGSHQGMTMLSERRGATDRPSQGGTTDGCMSA